MMLSLPNVTSLVWLVLVTRTTALHSGKIEDSNSSDALVNYWVYCSNCGSIMVPAAISIYGDNSCQATNFSNVEYFTAPICDDGSSSNSVSINYYSDNKCMDLTHSESYPTDTCFYPSESYDPLYSYSCDMPKLYAKAIEESYFTDNQCNTQPIEIDYHPIGCSESCPNAWNYGWINDTQYRYDYGCDVDCPPNDYCGNGEYGFVNICVKDEYSSFYRKVNYYQNENY